MPTATSLRSPPRCARVQRLHHTVGDPVIRRELKAGQSGKRVKGPDGTIYLAHQVSAGKYSLQPVSGAAAIEVDVGTAGYDAVGDVVSAEEVKNEVDPATHPAAGYSVLEWAAKLRHLIGDNDWRAASILVDRMKAVAGGLPTMDTPTLTDAELKSRFAKLPNGDKLKAAYADCLLAGIRHAEGAGHEHEEGVRRGHHRRGARGDRRRRGHGTAGGAAQAGHAPHAHQVDRPGQGRDRSEGAADDPRPAGF